MDDYSLDVLRSLAITLTLISIYCGLIPTKIGDTLLHIVKRRLPKKVKITYRAAVHSAAGMLLCIALLVATIINFRFLIYFFTIPSLLACLLVILFAFFTVIRIAFSEDDSQFSLIENNSLILMGLIFGIMGIPCFTDWFLGSLDESILGTVMDLVECTILVVSYSIYLFLTVALLIRALKPPIEKIEHITGRLAEKGRSEVELCKSFTIDFDWNNVFNKRENVWHKCKSKPLWKQLFIYLRLSYIFLVDAILYLLIHVMFFFVWFSIFGVWGIIFLASSGIRKIAQKAISISDHRITAISFRISIVASLLIVVITNRLTHIVSTENATAILEYISSVVIMPILIEWLYEILSQNNKTQHIEKGDNIKENTPNV